MKLQRKHLIGLAVVAVAAAGIVYSLRPKPLEVEIARVERGPLEETIDAEGRTRIRERYVVAAPVSGRVERLRLVEGAQVRTGEVVARIAPMPIDQQATAQARSQLDAVQALAREAAAGVTASSAVLAQRRRELERARRLAEAGGLAPREVELSELEVRQSEETHRAATERAEAAQANVRQARAALMSLGASQAALVLVRAPAAGRVLRVPERSARVVAAGTPLLELGDARHLEVVIDVLSSDGAAIAPGDPVRIEDWGGETSLVGRVRLVEPSAFTKVSALGVDEQRVNVLVDVASAPASVGDGFRVESRIVTWEAPDVLIVPTSALVRNGEGWVVFAVRDGRCERRTVRIGHMSDGGAEVLDGLEARQDVVLFPSDQVVQGARVVARKP